MNAWKWVLVVLGAVVVLVAILFLPILPAHSQVPSITVKWTSPGDDGALGTATTYEMRWSTTKPDTTSQASKLAWWNAATPVTGLPVPLVSGTEQSMTIIGPFLSGTYYYVMIRAADETPNWNDLSNVAVKFVPDATPPRRIIDLR